LEASLRDKTVESGEKRDKRPDNVNFSREERKGAITGNERR